MVEKWEDYYEILQVHPSAEPEIIKAAYRKLARKYHPDVNRDPATEEQMKKVNKAYEVLSNPEKRKLYHSEWVQKAGTWRGTRAVSKPKPVVDPEYIHFKSVKLGKVQTASFVIRNTGGHYTKIWVSNPNSWVRVVRYFSLTDSDELPLQVEIEVEGEEWGKSYIEYIRVKLDEEETQVKVALQTKPEPVREKVRVGARPRTRPTYTPPPSPPPSPPSPVSDNRGMPAWVKGIISLAALGLIIGLITQFWSSTNQIVPSEDTASTPVVQSTSVTQPTLKWSFPPSCRPWLKMALAKVIMAIPVDLNSDGKMNEIVAWSNYHFYHLYALTPDGELKEWVEVESESLMLNFVLSCAPIDYDLDKKFDEILVFGQKEGFETVNVFNSHGEKIYESQRQPYESIERIEEEFREMKTKYGYKISGQFIDENFNRIDLDGDGEFDDIIRIQENSIEVYSKIGS